MNEAAAQFTLSDNIAPDHSLIRTARRGTAGPALTHETAGSVCVHLTEHLSSSPHTPPISDCFLFTTTWPCLNETKSDAEFGAGSVKSRNHARMTIGPTPFELTGVFNYTQVIVSYLQCLVNLFSLCCQTNIESHFFIKGHTILILTVELLHVM